MQIYLMSQLRCPKSLVSIKVHILMKSTTAEQVTRWCRRYTIMSGPIHLWVNISYPSEFAFLVCALTDGVSWELCLVLPCCLFSIYLPEDFSIGPGLQPLRRFYLQQTLCILHRLELLPLMCMLPSLLFLCII